MKIRLKDIKIYLIASAIYEMITLLLTYGLSTLGLLVSGGLQNNQYIFLISSIMLPLFFLLAIIKMIMGLQLVAFLARKVKVFVALLVFEIFIVIFNILYSLEFPDLYSVVVLTMNIYILLNIKELIVKAADMSRSS